MLISRIADGALRDALSLLDRCASYGTEITEKYGAEVPAYRRAAEKFREMGVK